MQETMDLYKIRCKQLLKDGFSFDELNYYENFKELFTEQQFESILREKQNRKNKRYRTKNKFLEILKYRIFLNDENCKIVFGTITLDNKTLSQKENTYIRKIHKWLKEHFDYVILNKDFGSKTEREHYHFTAITTEDIENTEIKSKTGRELYKLKNKNYTLGHEPTLEIVNTEEQTTDKMLNYLLKLNNHSNKVGTKSRVRILKNERYVFYEFLTTPTKAEKRTKGKVKNWVLK